MVTLRQAAHSRHAVRVEEDVGALRRTVARAAGRLPGLPDGSAELAVTELATNILRHTTDGGYVLHRRAGQGIEIISVDRGPGTRTAGVPRWATATRNAALDPPRPGEGLGIGLAGVRRMASTFDCYSSPAGTVVLARLGKTEPVTGDGWRWGGVNVPYDDVGDSGDAWAVAPGRCLTALVVDGLGHGPGAARAAREAVLTFERWPVLDLDTYLGRAHEAMLGTRGGVIGVCAIDPLRDELSFAGIGNITGHIVRNGEGRSLLGRHGTVGAHLRPPKAQPAAYPWAPGATLILTSDGIRDHWDLSSYRGLLLRDPAVTAAVLHRDHQRGSDDATVLVVRDVRGHAGGEVRDGDT